MNRPLGPAEDPADDGDWLDALAGRNRPAGTATAAATQAEAQLWRQAHLRAARSAAEPVPALPDVQDLLARARAEGLLVKRTGWCAGCLARWQRWRSPPRAWGGAGLALASVLAALVVVLVQQTATEDQPAMRGADAAVVLRSAEDPSAAREQLARTLQGYGVQPHLYQRLGRWGLDADLPQPLPPGLLQALQAQGLAVPAGASLRVEFEARQP